LPFLLNLSFGNASLLPGVRLLDLELPAELAHSIGGPQFGIAGLRERLGVFERPLLATALKPRGTSVQRLAAMAEAFARGGGDLVKDDQNLVSIDRAAFERRVGACADAVARGNLRGGGHCAYFPHVSGPHGVLEQQLRFVQSLGLIGVLACPLILGMEHLRGLLREHRLALMAHPSWSGGHLLSEHGGIEHGLLLGRLFRLAGADISVFPNAGGRFSFSVEQCRSITRRLIEPWHELRPTFPAPAGGMQLGSIPRMCTEYGADAVFLIGGALLGHSSDLRASTEKFLRAMHEGMGGARC
jgi:ribulose-bisphosphate carboxylase large chain